jgi:hypothetical protein
MQVLRVPEQGYSQSQLESNVLDWACEVKTKVGKESAYRNRTVVTRQKSA